MHDIDPNALDQVTTRFALPKCLHVPIAAKGITAIERFIGDVQPIIHGHLKALCVTVDEPQEIDPSLIIWDMPCAEMIHRRQQVWVHVDYTAYRKAYRRQYPAEDIQGLVVDHIMNRRFARLYGFQYVRVVPITRAANSSSGGLTEKMGIEFQSLPQNVAWRAAHPMAIRYADTSDLAKMLSITTGNALHPHHNTFQQRLREHRR